MIRINEIKLNINTPFKKIKPKICKILKINEKNLKRVFIIKKSLDTRDKKNILYVYNVVIETKNISEDYIVFNAKNKNISIYQKKYFNPLIIKNKIKTNKNFIVVGSGPSGLFSSYILALNGFKPILLERGDEIEKRKIKVLNFINYDILDENSNVSFGDGGAGTFSDGKLYTRVDSNSEINNYFLNLLIKFGAKKEILYNNEPHIGTDCLTDILINLKKEILNLGGKFLYNYYWSPFDKIYGINNDNIILVGIGNSSRDTFNELYKFGFDLKPKDFAIGYRVIHESSLINKSIYGDENLYKKLGNANYHLKYHDNFFNKTAYSFCMCPGGYVINSSNFKNHLSINGMSFNDRNNKYSNSAIVININVDDYLIDNNPLSGVNFQNKIENEFFKIGNGKIPYCFFNDFYNETKNANIDIKNMFYSNSIYKNNFKNILRHNIKTFDFNEIFVKAMFHFNSIIDGFANKNTIICGIESRTSSPIKIDRNFENESNIKNVYPIGEGLGHGGGIVSCAIDGIKTALKIVERYK